MSKKLQNMDDIVRDARMKDEDENITKRLSHIRHKILVMSGKGGVGKTTIAAAIALGLSKRGKRVHLTTTDPAAHLKFVIDESSGITMSSIDENV